MYSEKNSSELAALVVGGDHTKYAAANEAMRAVTKTTNTRVREAEWGRLRIQRGPFNVSLSNVPHFA